MLSSGRHLACPTLLFLDCLITYPNFFHWSYSPQLCLEFSRWSIVFCTVKTSTPYFCVIFIIFDQMYIFTTQFSSALSDSLLCLGITTLSNFQQSRYHFTSKYCPCYIILPFIFVLKFLPLQFKSKPREKF